MKISPVFGSQILFKSTFTCPVIFKGGQPKRPNVYTKLGTKYLSEHGFTNVRRFAGGLEEWDEMGFPLEGDQIEKSIEADDNFTL